MSDCSKTEDFIHERERMCKFYENCEGCPATDLVAEDTRLCAAYEDDFIKDAIIVVQEWSDTHPLPKPKTYADVFFEMHKQAVKDHDGTPYCCRDVIFGTRTTHNDCMKRQSCSVCWNEPYKDGEQ